MLKKNISLGAIAVFLIFLWTPLLLFSFSCPDGHCSLAPNSSWSSDLSAPQTSSGNQTGASSFRTEFAPPHPAVARICVENAQTRNYGTGTWIRISKEQCAILTCAHLFETNSPERIAVSFPNHFSFNARIQAIDRDWDVALLQSAVGTDSSFSSFPSPVLLTLRPPKPDEFARLCGYGTDGRSLWMLGMVRGYCRLNAVSGARTLVVAGTARQGDSGAPILTLEGELAGVLWGTDGQALYGTWSGQIREVLKIDFASHGACGERWIPGKGESFGENADPEDEALDRERALDAMKIIDLQEIPRVDEDEMNDGKKSGLSDEKNSWKSERVPSDSREFSEEKTSGEARTPEIYAPEILAPETALGVSESSGGTRREKSASPSFSAFSSSFPAFSSNASEGIEEALRSRIFGVRVQDSDRAEYGERSDRAEYSDHAECADRAVRSEHSANAEQTGRVRKKDWSQGVVEKNERTETRRSESDEALETKKRKKTVVSAETKNRSCLLIGLYFLAWSMPIAAFFLLREKKAEPSQEKSSSESESHETVSDSR